MGTRPEEGRTGGASSPELPLVSAIVLNYNGARSIARCLESIEKQTYQRIETVVVDNNSSDGSMGTVELMFPNFKRIYNDVNLGFAEGNNVGIRSCSGDFVVLINNDLVLDREAIANLVSGLDGSPRTGILGGVIYYYDNPVIWAYGGYLEPVSGMHWQLFQGSPGDYDIPPRLGVDYVPGALLMVRRKLLEQVGLLGEYFFLYGDDIDLACKVKRLGYAVEVTSSVRSRHMVSQSVKGLNQRHELRGYYLMNRNMFHLYLVQLPLVFALTSTISQIAFGLFETTIFGRKGSYARTKIEALSQALRDIELARAERERAEGLGKLAIRPRIFALLKLVRRRSVSRVYYW